MIEELMLEYLNLSFKRFIELLKPTLALIIIIIFLHIFANYIIPKLNGGQNETQKTKATKL